MPSHVRKINKPVLILYILVVLFLAYVVWMYFTHRPSETGLAQTKKGILNFPWTAWEIVLYAHIITGSIAFAIGPFQFLKRSHVQNLNLHRLLGKLYVTAIFLSVPCGVYVALYATGGLPGTVSFIGLDLAWLATTFLALKRVRQRNIAAHREWMFRIYAVTLTFVTFRIEVGLFIALFGINVAFPLTVWVALIGNLLVTEWLLRRTRKAQQRVSSLHV